MHGFVHDRQGAGQPRRRSPHRKRYRTALKRALASALALRGEPIQPTTRAETTETHGVATQYVAAMNVILMTRT